MYTPKSLQAYSTVAQTDASSLFLGGTNRVMVHWHQHGCSSCKIYHIVFSRSQHLSSTLLGTHLLLSTTRSTFC